MFHAAPAAAQDPPGAVTSINITSTRTSASSSRVTLTWPTVAGRPPGYDFHYTTNTTAADTAHPTNNHGTGWLPIAAGAGDGGGAPTITESENLIVKLGKTSRWRVRARNAAGVGPWGFAAIVMAGPPGASAPPAPTRLEAAPGNARLDLSWTADSRATGRQVHYTSAPTSGSGAVTNAAAVQTGANPSAAAGWVAASGAGTTASQPITGLANDTEYRVRVRFSNGSGSSAWTFGTGTPAAVSANADLRGLTASAARGSGTAPDPLRLTPSPFSADATSYAATVSSLATHLRLTPQVWATGRATVGVRKGSTGDFTAVRDGSTSGEIALDEGANAVTVRVTAEDGTTRKDYTVTVTRLASDGSPVAALVSNVGSRDHSVKRFDDPVRAQAFTTGSHAEGYVLGSVEANIIVGITSSPSTTLAAAELATLRAELWSDSSDNPGRPGAKLIGLTVPDAVSAGTVEFAAPAGAVLEPSTTYFMIVYTTGSLVRAGLADAGVRPRGPRRGPRLEHRGPTHLWDQCDHAGGATPGPPPSKGAAMKIRVNGYPVAFRPAGGPEGGAGGHGAWPCRGRRRRGRRRPTTCTTRRPRTQAAARWPTRRRRTAPTRRPPGWRWTGARRPTRRRPRR